MTTTTGNPRVAVLIADWISEGPGGETPHDRFVAYYKAAGHASRLQQFLMNMVAQRPADIANDAAGALLDSTGDGFRLRGQVYFHVTALLVERGVDVSGDGEAVPVFDSLDDEDD